MIFKIFDSDKDTFSSKLGIFGKSFEDIGNRFKKVSEELIITNDYTISNIANAWKNSSIKKDLSDKFIITQSDIQDKLKDLSVYNQNPSDILNDLQKTNKTSKFDSTAWQKYFDTLEEGEKWQAKFVQTNDLTKVSFDDVKNAQNAAKQSAIAYNNGLKEMTIGAKAANVALKGLAMAGNMIAMWAVTFVLQKAVEGISSLINETENLKQSSEDLISSYNSALDTFKSHKETISEISDEYSKLSSGVNNLGENVSLSTDDFEKYRDLNSQIADMFPDMVTGYNSQGDAILSLKGNVEELTEALKEEEKAAYNSLVASGKDSNGNDIMKYYKDITEGSLWDNITGKANSTSQYTALNDVLGMTDVNDFNRYMGSMNLAWGSGMDNGIYQYLTSLGYAMDMTQDEFDALIEKTTATRTALDAELEQGLAGVRTLGNAYMNLDSDYQNLDSNSQSALSMLINSIDAETATSFDNDEAKLSTYVSDLIDKVEDNPSVKKDFSELFSLDYEDMPVDKACAAVEKYLETISSKLGIDVDDLKERFGFSNLFDSKSRLDSSIETIGNGNSDEIQKLQKYTEGFSTSQTEAWLEATNGAKSAEEAIRKYEKILEGTAATSLSFTDAIAQVQSLSDGLDQLDKIYADVYNKEDFDWSSILNNDSFKEAFGNMTNVTSEYSDAYDDFIKTVSNSPSDLSACQSAFDNLASAYIQNSGVLDDLTESTKSSAVTMLEQMGISNADAIVSEKLAGKKLAQKAAVDKLNWANEDSVDSTLASVSALLKDSDASDIAKSSLFELIAQETIFSNSGLDVSEKISALGELAVAYGIVADAASQSQIEQDIRLAKHYGGSEQDVLDAYYNKYQKAVEAKFGQLSSAKYAGSSAYKSAVDKANKASKDSASTSEPTVETFDFIETAVKRCEERIDSFKTTAENTYKSLSTRTKAYADLINETTNEINLQQQAYNSYMAKANSFGLGEEWASQVRNGSINIADVTDDVLKEQIKNYQTYYEKAKSALDTVADLRTELTKLKTEKIQLEIDVKGNKLDTLESQLDKIQNRMDLKESWGFTASAGDYRNLNSNLKKQIANLTSQNSLIKSQQSLVKKGSEQWYEYKKAIDDNNASIQDLTKSMAENATSMSEIANNKASTKVDKLDSSDEMLKAREENESYYKKQNSLINSEIKNIKKRQSAYDKAVSTNKSSLSSSIKSINKTKGNKSLMKQIKSYTKSKKEIPSSLLNKALSLKDNGTLYEKLVRYNAYLAAYETSVETAKLYKQTSASDKADLVKQKSDNIASYYSNKQTKYTQRAQEINDVISIIEENGYKATKEYYKKLLSLEKSNNKTLVAEKEKLVSQLQSGIKDGSIEINSDDYYELVSQINDVTNAIDESTLSMTQFQNQIRQVSWDNFDALRDRISDFTSEVDFLISELSREDLTDSDTGKLTENGRAVRGLYASNYTTYTAQAKAYASEIKSINKELASDPYNETLLDRKKELVEAYQNAISSAQEEKYAILDLQEQAYDSLIDKIGDLISEYENLLDTQKNAYEYQQKMNDLAEERASIQKQLQAYAGDMSEENRARIQQLNVQLKDSEKSIQEAQYDKFISDTKDMLSDLQDDLTDAVQDIIDELSKNFDELIAEIKSDSTITSTISDKMEEIGYIGTDELKTVLNGSDIVSTTKTAITAIEKLQKAIEEYSSQIASAVTSNDNSVLSSLQDASLSKIEKNASKAEENANDYKNDRDSIKRSMAEKQSEITDWQSKKTKQEKTVSSAYKSYKTALSKYGKNSSKTKKAKENYEKQKAILEDINNNLKYVSDEYDALDKRYSEANSNYKRENAKYKALNYLAEHLSSGTDSYESYSDINKKLFSKYSGMVLSNSEMKELAEILGVKYDNANSSGNLYKKLKSIKVPGFKVGSKHIPEDMLAMLSEEGAELQFDADKGVLRQVGEGDKIFTSEMSDRLWELAANPNLMSMNFKPVIPNIPTNMNSSIDSSTNVVINELALPGITNYEEFRAGLIKDSEFEKAVQDMTINKITGRSSSLSKLRYTK